MKAGLYALLFAFTIVATSAQKLTPVTAPGQEVGKQIKLYDGHLYYSTIEEKGSFKIWSYDISKKKSKLVMKSDENIGHFFEMGKTLLFTLNKGHEGEDGKLYYLDDHRKPVEVLMKEEAGADVEPGKGRKLEIYEFRKGILILAPIRDMHMKFKLYRYKFGNEKDSARLFFPENYFVLPGLFTSSDQKLIFANVEITPPHPWENTKEFWNKFSQMTIIHNDDNGKNYEKWMDHALFYEANFKYTKRTWMNVHYKEFKDKGDDVDHHSVFVITSPVENKGTLPKHVAEAADSSMFLYQKKISYYLANKGNIYLATAFEYPTSYQLKYSKLAGHSMSDFVRIQGQYAFEEVLYIITQHKAAGDYYNAWTVKYKFDTAEWLEAHTFFPTHYDPELSAVLPSSILLRTFRDTLGNAIFLGDANKLFILKKNGANPLPTSISNVNYIISYWRGNLLLRQKGQGDDEQLGLYYQTGTGNFASQGDKYLADYSFEYNGHLFFEILSAQNKKQFNWQTDGTLEGTKRMELGDLSLHLDFSRPYIDENNLFLWGRVGEKLENKDQIYELDM